ncbi:MAG: thiamine-phosphate kinase, partial [Bacteroidales bacterium]
PANISVNLGISTRHRIEDIEAIFQGVEYACNNYSLKMTDIYVESSLTGLTIAVHATGTAQSDPLPHPAENDLICVTGNLGAAFLGLHILERERKVFEETGGAQPKLDGYEFIIGRQLKPDLPVKKLDEIIDAGIVPTSLMVTREGIASDLIGLCRTTSTGCRVYAEKIPVATETATTAEELGIEPVTSTLNGGDDFEFIFTVPISESKKVLTIDGISVIGHIAGAGDGCHLVLQDGSLAELRAPGWEE